MIVQIFNASHMAPYDNPHVTHDMILRFMGVNFSSITDGSARIPSSVGDDVKPVFGPQDQKPTPPPAGAGKTPEQDKAMWEGNSQHYSGPSSRNPDRFISILQRWFSSTGSPASSPGDWHLLLVSHSLTTTRVTSPAGRGEYTATLQHE